MYRVLLSSINDSSHFARTKTIIEILAKPYFLTRQTANLMEDFTRELSSGSALLLLHGENGMGKTRLLEELCRIRLTEHRVHWIDLGQGSHSEGSSQDNSRKLETLFAEATQGDIIIADHFEMALQKSRHQLFVSWSAEGVDKQLNLIVTSSTESFEELRQLSQQYQLSVKISQLEPLDNDEVDAFINFFLFPDRVPGKLSIPATLRGSLSDAQGAVGQVIGLLKLYGKQIKSSPAGESGSTGKTGRVIVWAFMFVLVATGVGWYTLNNQPGLFESEPQRVVIETEAEAPEFSATKIDSEVAVDTGTVSQTHSSFEPVVESASQLETAHHDEPQSMLETNSEEGVGAGATTESTNESEVSSETEVGELPARADGTGVAATTETETEAIEKSTQQIDTQPVEVINSNDQSAGLAELTGSERFRRDLETSYSWLDDKADTVGTLQIILLSHKTFDETVYYDYIESLAKKQVDVTQLKVLKTSNGSTEFYGVFYGEYASRQLANKARGDLPEVIRDIPPVARSVGSILQEIRRLEGES